MNRLRLKHRLAHKVIYRDLPRMLQVDFQSCIGYRRLLFYLLWKAPTLRFTDPASLIYYEYALCHQLASLILESHRPLPRYQSDGRYNFQSIDIRRNVPFDQIQKKLKVSLDRIDYEHLFRLLFYNIIKVRHEES